MKRFRQFQRTTTTLCGTAGSPGRGPGGHNKAKEKAVMRRAIALLLISSLLAGACSADDSTEDAIDELASGASIDTADGSVREGDAVPFRLPGIVVNADGADRYKVAPYGLPSGVSVRMQIWRDGQVVASEFGIGNDAGKLSGQESGWPVGWRDLQPGDQLALEYRQQHLDGSYVSGGEHLISSMVFQEAQAGPRLVEWREQNGYYYFNARGFQDYTRFKVTTRRNGDARPGIGTEWVPVNADGYYSGQLARILATDLQLGDLIEINAEDPSGARDRITFYTYTGTLGGRLPVPSVIDLSVPDVADALAPFAVTVASYVVPADDERGLLNGVCNRGGRCHWLAAARRSP